MKISADIKALLDLKVNQYNNPDFIDNDPIGIPHQFSKKEDIEIAAFLSATIAWGNRKSIIKNANRMMDIMDRSPHDFIMNFTKIDLERCQGFVHRTFNQEDLQFFLVALQNIYKNHGGLEQILSTRRDETTVKNAITRMRNTFFENIADHRSFKHISNPQKGSAAKRINMFLRWMVRKDNAGVDFGIWSNISMHQLSIPLDVHTGNIGRQIGLLHRKQNDWKAVSELDGSLRLLDPIDPVKYDFALFGIGVNGDLS